MLLLFTFPCVHPDILVSFAIYICMLPYNSLSSYSHLSRLIISLSSTLRLSLDLWQLFLSSSHVSARIVFAVFVLPCRLARSHISRRKGFSARVGRSREWPIVESFSREQGRPLSFALSDMTDHSCSLEVSISQRKTALDASQRAGGKKEDWVAGRWKFSSSRWQVSEHVSPRRDSMMNDSDSVSVPIDNAKKLARPESILVTR